MPIYGDPRDLDTFNDFDDEPRGYDWQYEFGEAQYDGCPQCGEPAVAAWDHMKECPHYEEMMDLPF